MIRIKGILLLGLIASIAVNIICITTIISYKLKLPEGKTWLDLPWQAIAGLLGGSIALWTYWISKRQKDEHFEREELAKRFTDIVASVANAENPVVRMAGLLRLVDHAMIIPTYAKTKEGTLPYCEACCSLLVSSLQLDARLSVRRGAGNALNMLAARSKESRSIVYSQLKPLLIAGSKEIFTAIPCVFHESMYPEVDDHPKSPYYSIGQEIEDDWILNFGSKVSALLPTWFTKPENDCRYFNSAYVEGAIVLHQFPRMILSQDKEGMEHKINRHEGHVSVEGLLDRDLYIADARSVLIDNCLFDNLKIHCPSQSISISRCFTRSLTICKSLSSSGSLINLNLIPKTEILIESLILDGGNISIDHLIQLASSPNILSIVWDNVNVLQGSTPDGEFADGLYHCANKHPLSLLSVNDSKDSNLKLLHSRAELLTHKQRQAIRKKYGSLGIPSEMDK